VQKNLNVGKIAFKVVLYPLTKIFLQ